MRKGKIEIIMGPMFSGKSSELIRRLTIHGIAKKNIVVFKHKSDDRFGRPQDISTRNNTYISSIPVLTVADMYEHIDIKTIDLIGIDEVHWFDRDELVALCQKLVDEHGISVIACGLDMDYMKVPFDTAAHLMAIADSVYKTSAVCMQCRDTDAIYTHRLAGGDARMEIGSDNYEPRCRYCR